jgi:hypothetical protein
MADIFDAFRLDAQLREDYIVAYKAFYDALPPMRPQNHRRILARFVLDHLHKTAVAENDQLLMATTHQVAKHLTDHMPPHLSPVEDASDQSARSDLRKRTVSFVKSLTKE